MQLDFKKLQCHILQYVLFAIHFQNTSMVCTSKHEMWKHMNVNTVTKFCSHRILNWL